MCTHTYSNRLKHRNYHIGFVPRNVLVLVKDEAHVQTKNKWGWNAMNYFRNATYLRNTE